MHRNKKVHHPNKFLSNDHNITNYNHGEYELLVKMDNLFEEKYLDEPHHFVFTIENPSNETVTFAFKSRNFVNTTEYMNDTIIEMGPNISQCIEEEEEEVTDAPEKEKEKEKEDQGTDGTQTPNTDISKDNEDIETDTEKPTTEPCEREIIVVNETYLNWTEEYPIPEVFYFTNNYTIQPHQSMTLNITMTFEKNPNTSEGGYFIITEMGKKS